MTEQELEELHKHCNGNRRAIKQGAKAGCFYCLEIFPKEDVDEFDDRDTAICPKCGIDSVLSQSVFSSLGELKKALRPMQDRWFNTTTDLNGGDLRVTAHLLTRVKPD